MSNQLIKSPLRYPGGKSRAVKRISEMAPKNFDEFREPFLGGASVYLYFKQMNPKCSFWVNDKYEDLYLFWKEVQNDIDGLAKQVRDWKHLFQSDGKGFYDFLNAEYANMSDKERGAAFFCYNRMTFSGTTLSGGFSQSAYSGRFTDSSIERLSKLKGLFNGTKLTNLDFEKSITTSGKNVFLFLDPPYYSAENSKLYGRDGSMHTGFDHEKLAKLLKTSKHKFLITYDDSEYIRNLYDDWANIKAWTLKYGMRNVNVVNQEGAELFISNY